MGANSLNLSKIQQAGQLYLLTKAALNAMSAGMQTSQRVGHDQEFSQYRAYQPGDDPRAIDWKVYARQRKFYIKESQPPKTSQLNIFLDDSASMNHHSGQHTKWDFGRWLSAQLGFISLGQRDQILIQTSQKMWPQGNELANETRLINFLTNIKASGQLTDYRGLGKHNHPHGLQIIISDLFEKNQELKELLNRRRSLSTGAIWVLHLVAPEELNPKLLGKNAIVQDLETGRQVQLNANDIAKARENFNNWQTSWKNWCIGKGISYFPVLIDQLPGTVLSKFLSLQNLRRN